MSSVLQDQKIIAELVLRGAGNEACRRPLYEGQRLYIGADEGCDICLPEDGVSATHCLISTEGRAVTIQDCYSQNGTFVDDERIQNRKLTQDGNLQVGCVEIAVRLKTPAIAEVEPSNSSRCMTDADSANEPFLKVESPAEEQSAKEPSLEDQLRKTIQELQSELQMAHAEIDVLQQRSASPPARSASVPVADPFQEEMIELLKSEVLELQAALADRDSQTNPQMNPAEQRDEDMLSQAESEKLVSRLEQLLEELEERDLQVSTLTELLESAEQTSQAEQEERNQIDNWIQDIEERFGYREQEWRAQRAKLQQAVDTLTAERDRAEAAVQADNSNARLEAVQKVMLELRSTVEDQRQQLSSAEATIERLQSDLEESRSLRHQEDQVRLAEERAELARERQELETQRNDSGKKEIKESDLKLQVLRQHLKEVHEQEQKEKEERKLSSRLARLWNRLDGR